MKLFQQFSTACGKPLKRLSPSTGTMHRAKAPVLMRKSQRGRGSLIRATTLACIVMAFSAFGAEDEAVAKPATGTSPRCSELLNCKFTNELGQAVSLNDFHGQALAITFFFSRCPIPQYCPRLARNFQEASKKLLATPNAPTNWHFLSFSFDPDFDTATVLKAYGKRYDYDPRHWSFLTGPKDKLAALAAESNVTFEPDSGFYNHNFRTLIIDAAGHLQMVFPTGGDLSGAIVTEILKAAAVTNHPAGAGVPARQ